MVGGGAGVLLRRALIFGVWLIWFHFAPQQGYSMPTCTGGGTCSIACVAGPGGYAQCSGNGAPCDVCNSIFGTTGECAGCTDYGFNFADCTDVDNTGGTCSWDGSCCQVGSAAAPELPAGVFWYFVVATILLVFGVQAGKVRSY
jgi:hypothetical protein